MVTLTSETAAFLDELVEAMEQEHSETTRQLLEEIGITVRRTARVTDGQRRAVRNIRARSLEDLLPSQRLTRPQSRRYEGYERSRD